MRSFVTRIAAVAAFTAVSAFAPALYAAGPASAAAAAGNAAAAAAGTGTVAVAATPAVSPRKSAAAAKAAWKTASAQIADPVRASLEPFSLNIVNGDLVLDGVKAKERMNYTIDKANYLSFYLPGAGTMVVSTIPTPDAVLVKGAFTRNALLINAAGHTVRLITDAALSDKVSQDAYVRFDNSAAAAHQGSFTMMGYGVLTQGPYSSSSATFVAQK